MLAAEHDMKLALGSVLLTDLYELTMLQAYFDAGMNETASFELFVRALPAHRNFLMAAGLEQVVDYLEQLRFSSDELSSLSRTGRFSTPFLRSLEHLRFTGDVDAMSEGTVFFPEEPIVRITAPIREAQLVESRVMNLAHFETVVASKAARCVLAAPDKLLVDFGLRRAHGAEAGWLSARACFLAGCGGTATATGVRGGRAAGTALTTALAAFRAGRSADMAVSAAAGMTGTVPAAAASGTGAAAGACRTVDGCSRSGMASTSSDRPTSSSNEASHALVGHNALPGLASGGAGNAMDVSGNAGLERLDRIE